MDLEVDSDTLRQVAEHMRQAAGKLDEAVSQPAPAPDAGESSDKVAAVLADITRLGVAIARVEDGNAGKIDLANGTYEEVENSEAGYYERQLDKADPRRGDWRDND